MSCCCASATFREVGTNLAAPLGFVLASNRLQNFDFGWRDDVGEVTQCGLIDGALLGI